MEEESENTEKTEDPSSHRIEEFRKRGDVSSSKELTSVLILSASILTLSLSLLFIFETLSGYMEWLYGLNADQAFGEKNFSTIVEKTFKTGLVCSGPVLLVSLCIGIFSNVAQVGFLFSTEVLTFKPERLDPIQGIKKLISMKSLVEAVKGILKFSLILVIVYFFMKDQIDTFGGFFHMDFFQSFLYGKDILSKLGFSIVIGMGLVALGDFAFQKLSYRKRLMMTKVELKKETKEQEGNPEIKQRIRNIQREMAQKRMMSEIPTADVIVTNPTHISIIIKYDDKTMISPTVVGKGSDFLALRIREVAKEHGVPIVENVPLARTLFKTVKVGHGVPRTLYKAVAEILAFVYRLKRKKRALN